MFKISRPSFTSIIFFSTVFITGMAVLIFEVAAVRMFAPYFGSSLYVLSSVLTTILAALSFGYYLGGRVADKFPHPRVLYIIIGSAGTIMLFLLSLSQYILPSANAFFSITTGPLVLSLILFFIPAFLLGIDSPFVIKLLTAETDVSKNGSVVGSTFFFSTIGSIIGSIMAGFFFIPYLGLTLTILTVSVTLIAWAIIATLVLEKITPVESVLPTFISKLPLPLLFLISISSALFLSYIILNFQNNSQTITTLYQKDAFYSNIHIFEKNIRGTSYRFLKNDVNSSSAIIPGSNELVFSYAQFADIFKDNGITAQNYLVLGGGSYTIPRTIHAKYPALAIDVVEVEASLYPLSKIYFELPDTPKITNYVEDARVFLQSTSTLYDVIFSDVMNSGLFIPPHLSTLEFFTAFKKRLAPEGIAIINFIGSLNQEEKSLTGSMLKTITAVFPNHKMLAVNGADYLKTQNILFILRHDSLPIVIQNQAITNHLNGTTIDSKTMAVDSSKFDLAKQVVFTDDRSQVEPLILKQFVNLKL